MTLEELEARVKVANGNGTLKFNIRHDDGGSEGVWACFATAQDKEVYDRNEGEGFEVFLMNQALIGGPNWGARVRLKSGGDSRPVIEVAELIRQIADAVESGDYPTPGTPVSGATSPTEDVS